MSPMSSTRPFVLARSTLRFALRLATLGIDIQRHFPRQHADPIGPRLPCRAQFGDDVRIRRADVVQLGTVARKIVELPRVRVIADELPRSAADRSIAGALPIERR